MNIIQSKLDDVLIIEPDIFEDSRGYFMEIYQQQRYFQAGIDCIFVQDNISHSAYGTIRGLHYQLTTPQAKLVCVVKGTVVDVVVDIRCGSSSFGEWIGIELSDTNKRQAFIPEGFAHGFSVLSDTAIVIYKCSNAYDPDDEKGILYSDPDICIDWKVKKHLVSPKDTLNQCLRKIPENQLPKY